MTAISYAKLPRKEKRHFMRCNICKDYFDMRRLDQAVFHMMAHHNASDLS